MTASPPNAEREAPSVRLADDTDKRAGAHEAQAAAVGPICVLGLDGGVRFSNTAFSTIAERALPLSGSNGTRAIDSAMWQAIVAELEANNGTTVRELPLDLGGMDFRLKFTRVAGAGGESAVVCTTEEITQIAAARSLAYQAQDRFEDIARLVSDWVWECDRNFSLTYVSPRVLDVLDVHPLELRGRNLFDLGDFHAASPAAADRLPTPATRSPFRDETFEIVRRDGRHCIFKISGLPVFSDRDGSFLGFRGTAKDITSETEAWAKALRSQQRLIDAIESISEGFALFDTDERLVLCNSRMRQIYKQHAHLLTPGRSFAELARASIDDESELLGQPVEDWLAERMRQIQAGRSAAESRVGDRWVRVNDHRTSDGDTVSVRTDITELKRRELALVTAKEEAELANRTKSEFLANMSHELRTPLNAIIGFGQIMRDELFGPLGSDRYREYIGDVQDSAYHLLNIINDILDVSKAEAGKLDLAEEAIDIAETIVSAVRLVRDRAFEGQVRLEQTPADPLPPLFADERKVKQILLNLLSNAIKFTPAGGAISITADITETGNLAVAVTDTGVGMDAEQVQIALTKFGQVDSALSRSHAGTGLGLPLCSALIELHGGTLTIDSTPGEGTTVRIEFPAERLEKPT